MGNSPSDLPNIPLDDIVARPKANRRDELEESLRIAKKGLEHTERLHRAGVYQHGDRVIESAQRRVNVTEYELRDYDYKKARFEEQTRGKNVFELL